MGHESFGIPRAEAPREQEDFFDETLYADNSATPEEPTEALDQGETSWDSEYEGARYKEQLATLRSRQTELEDAIGMIHDDPDIAGRFSEEQMHELFDQRESLQNETFTASANYPGDWTLLLRDRMLDPTTKERFIAQRTEAMLAMPSGEPSTFERRPREFQSHYQAQIDNYDTRVEEIFSRTNIGNAADFGKSPRNLGQSGIDQPGTIFTDATHQDRFLSNRQLNMVEAHEKGHGLRDYTSPIDTAEIKSIIDEDALEELTEMHRERERLGEKEGRFQSRYAARPDEIIERMAQFKNYFGMGAQDTFEKKHLDYIREHYTADTGLDNGINDLLTCVTPKTEAAFLKVINKYPI